MNILPSPFLRKVSRPPSVHRNSLLLDKACDRGFSILLDILATSNSSGPASDNGLEKSTRLMMDFRRYLPNQPGPQNLGL